MPDYYETGSTADYSAPSVAAPVASPADLERQRLNQLLANINGMFYRADFGSNALKPFGGSPLYAGSGEGQVSSLRQPLYSQVYNDVFGAQKAKLDEQADTQRRKLGFNLADRGLTGGSADIDTNAMEGRAYNDSLLQASEQAQSQADQMKSNDEKTRLNLISSARSGADDASTMSSAYQQMQDNLSSAKTNAGYGAVDSYLSNVSPLFVYNAQQQGINNARNGYPSIYGVPRTTSGKVTG